mmetsp:Transcript_8175/g.20326  ORF Transcript_8175/g.20326 Transcript_8175/m.20326 type:complete len:318 (+) Transcript_8175:1004-1957(+)
MTLRGRLNVCACSEHPNAGDDRRERLVDIPGAAEFPDACPNTIQANHTKQHHEQSQDHCTCTQTEGHKNTRARRHSPTCPIAAPQHQPQEHDIDKHVEVEGSLHRAVRPSSVRYPIPQHRLEDRRIVRIEQRLQDVRLLGRRRSWTHQVYGSHILHFVSAAPGFRRTQLEVEEAFAPLGRRVVECPEVQRGQLASLWSCGHCHRHCEASEKFDLLPCGLEAFEHHDEVAGRELPPPLHQRTLLQDVELRLQHRWGGCSQLHQNIQFVLPPVFQQAGFAQFFPLHILEGRRISAGCVILTPDGISHHPPPCRHRRGQD